MKGFISGLSVLLLCTGCAGYGGGEPDATAPPPAAEAANAPADPAAAYAAPAPAAPAAPAPSATAQSANLDCDALAPWNQAARTLNHPVVQTVGAASGRPIYTIKNVSYGEIAMDRDLIGGVRLLDRAGREPAANTMYNIVWTPEDVTADYRNNDGSASKCPERFAAPTFFDVR